MSGWTEEGAAVVGVGAKHVLDMADGGGQSKVPRMDLKEVDAKDGQGDEGSETHSQMISSYGSDDFLYKMNHKQRGQFIIINNKTFEAHTGLTERDGTDVDASNLYDLFTSLGFDVKRYNDQKAHDMFKIIRDAGDDELSDHSDRDCFGLAVLSHGEADLVYGVDEGILITRLIAPIKNCKSLAGKPKLLFFQACRGCQLDPGVVMSQCSGPGRCPANVTDSKRESPVCIPIEADFLYAYSTTFGYYSFRNDKFGSWFVQALVMVLKDKNLRENFDISRLLNRVCHIVAYDFESNVPSKPFLHAKKQVPSIVSMLTKDLYFK